MPMRETVTIFERRLPKVLEYSTETLPTKAPLDGGAKSVVKLTFRPGERITGRLRPLTLNPVPDTVTS